MPSQATGDILNALRALVQSLRVTSRAAEKQLGLSGAQLFVLETLASGDSLSIGELAERTFTHQSSVSVVVSRLIEQKLVASSKSPDDARKVLQTITEAGRKKLKAAPVSVQDRLIRALAKQKTSDLLTTRTVLLRVMKDAGTGEGAPPMFFEEVGLKKKVVAKKESAKKK